ncbi:MAG: hypothetical protein H6727_18890 [Myxococcales bacterium]|nr:hypothetical protein [Myxococcales bacterium]
MPPKAWISSLFLLCFFLWIGCGPTPAPHGELIILTDGNATLEKSDIPEASEPSSPEESSFESHPPEIDAETNLPETIIEQQPEPFVESAPAPEPAPESNPEPSLEPSPETQPEPSGNRWIGESCSQDSDCNFPSGRCLAAKDGYPNGHCTQDCTSTCPDQPGKPTTFCIQAPNQTSGICVSQCPQSTCRNGYTCQGRGRYQQPSVQRNVCLPPSTTPTQSVTALYIGDSQSSGTKFAQAIVAYLRNPGDYCSNPKTQGNTVFSYAKVSSASRHWSEQSGSSKDWLCGATLVYTNGTAAQNTDGTALCAGITNTTKSIFERRIEVHKPNTFFIQLGGNSMGFAESYVKSRIQRMLDQMPQGSLCFWVTPSFSSSTYLAKRRDIERWTREVLQSYTRIQCDILTSIDEISMQTACPSFNTSDGIHMTSCGSQLWGQVIISKLCALQKL